MKYIVVLVFSISIFAFNAIDYQVSFFSNQQAICAGTLIAKNQIITTASCAFTLVAKKESLAMYRNSRALAFSHNFKVQVSSIFKSLDESSPPYVLMSHNLAVLSFSESLIELSQFPQILMDEVKANQFLLALSITNIHKIRNTLEGDYLSLNGKKKTVLQEGYGLIAESAGALKLLGIVQGYSLLDKENNLSSLVDNKDLKIEANYSTSKGSFIFNLSKYLQSLSSDKEASQLAHKLISASGSNAALEIIEAVTHESVNKVDVNSEYRGKIIVNYFNNDNTSFIAAMGIR